MPCRRRTGSPPGRYRNRPTYGLPSRRARGCPDGIGIAQPFRIRWVNRDGFGAGLGRALDLRGRSRGNVPTSRFGKLFGDDSACFGSNRGLSGNGRLAGELLGGNLHHHQVTILARTIIAGRGVQIVLADVQQGIRIGVGRRRPASLIRFDTAGAVRLPGVGLLATRIRGRNGLVAVTCCL